MSIRPFTNAAAGALLAVLMVGSALLGGCATTSGPAPVVDRGPAGKTPPVAPAPVMVKPEPAPPATPKPDSSAVVVTPLPSADAPLPPYTVKQGDTLFAIAKTHGISVRELVAWNNLEEPFTIFIGQTLRLAPPSGVAATPVKPGAAEPRRPDTPSGDAAVKTGPLAQRVPYSDEAFARMTKSPEPVARVEMKPEPKPDAKPEPKPAAKAEAPRADSDLNWAWPAEGQVVANFNEGSNKGIIIAGKRGQPVRASAAGRVIFSGIGIRGLGKLVVIRHNSNYLSVYAHNDNLLVKEGQTVTRGQRIADMGNSDADQVKLHFEIRRQGKPVDPIKLLPGM